MAGGSHHVAAAAKQERAVALGRTLPKQDFGVDPRRLGIDPAEKILRRGLADRANPAIIGFGYLGHEPKAAAVDLDRGRLGRGDGRRGCGEDGDQDR